MRRVNVSFEEFCLLALRTFKAKMFIFVGLFMIYLPCLTKICALQQDQRSLYRFPNGHLKFVNLKKVQRHYLQEAIITSSLVTDEFECAFLCVGELKCYSSNLASLPDSKGLYMCELLSTDKYRAPDKLRPDTSFHHFSPWVSWY